MSALVIYLLLEYICDCVLGLFLYNSIIKYEAIYHLATLMDNKRAFMRYIAHELRTPLNSASLGLKLITTTLTGTHQ